MTYVIYLCDCSKSQLHIFNTAERIKENLYKTLQDNISNIVHFWKVLLLLLLLKNIHPFTFLFYLETAISSQHSKFI